MSSIPNQKKRVGQRPSRGRRRKKPRQGLQLEVLSGSFAVCRLAPDAEIPSWSQEGPFSSISRSAEELSVVCDEAAVPGTVDAQRGWKALKVGGPLDMELIGVMASLAMPLARAKVSLFAISTFDTDYLLVREKNLDRAVDALRDFGHRVEGVSGLTEVDERPSEGDTKDRSDDSDTSENAPKERKSMRLTPLASPKATPRGPEAIVGRKEKRPTRLGPLPGAPEYRAREPSAEKERSRTKRRGRSEPQRRARERPERPRPEALEEPGTEPRRPTPPSPEEPSVAPGQEAGKTPDEVGPLRVFEELEPETPHAEVPAAKRPPAKRPAAPPSRPGRLEDVTSEGLYAGGIPQHPVEITDQLFSSLGLSEPILQTVVELGFKHPTPIQAGVIPHALSGRDVIGLAETGSGKTAAFSLPLAERLTHGRGVRGLILCPTREIALQTQAFLDIFGRDHQLQTVVVIGGVRMSPQIQALRRSPDIIVATPGRLADHMRRRNVRLSEIEHLVLDEADHMLDLGFLPQIKEILEQVPEERQTMMFSATMPPPIERLTQQFMRDPERVDFRPEGHAASGIEHRLYLVKDEGDRKKCVIQLLREVPGSTLIFVRRKLHTEWLARQLELAGFPVERIHSDRSQGQRVNALRGFREGQHEVLVATDVAARGIDVPGIRHVINYGLPESVEDYVHRAGRTARGSAQGIVSSIGTWQDKETVREIEHTIGQKLPRRSAEGVDAYVELKPRRTVRRRRLL